MAKHTESKAARTLAQRQQADPIWQAWAKRQKALNARMRAALKLDAQRDAEIRQRYDYGFGLEEIAAEFGISAAKVTDSLLRTAGMGFLGR